MFPHSRQSSCLSHQAERCATKSDPQYSIPYQSLHPRNLQNSHAECRSAGKLSESHKSIPVQADEVKSHLYSILTCLAPCIPDKTDCSAVCFYLYLFRHIVLPIHLF